MAVKVKPNLTIGADPELFLVETPSGLLKSSIGIIGGSKNFPRPLGRTGFAAQEDNVAVEFNIPPAETVEAFVSSIEWAIHKLNNEVAPKGLVLAPIASATFPREELRNPQAQAFGCTPDYNAWQDGMVNAKPYSKNKALRSCGGHVHFGWENPTDELRITIIKAADLFQGVPSVLMDNDTKRRELYGKAGCFRPTDYGVEYRTLSNFWLRSRELIEWAYTQAVRAFNFASNPDNHWLFIEEGDKIQTAINNNDKKLAQDLVQRFNLVTV